MTIHPEKETVFLEEINALMTASQAEEGNVSYKLFKDTDKENTFLMVEVWKDDAAVQSHNVTVAKLKVRIPRFIMCECEGCFVFRSLQRLLIPKDRCPMFILNF
nr:putative quinol monooxygenase [Bacillus subtilis]